MLSTLNNRDGSLLESSSSHTRAELVEFVAKTPALNTLADFCLQSHMLQSLLLFTEQERDDALLGGEGSHAVALDTAIRTTEFLQQLTHLRDDDDDEEEDTDEEDDGGAKLKPAHVLFRRFVSTGSASRLPYIPADVADKLQAKLQTPSSNASEELAAWDPVVALARERLNGEVWPLYLDSDIYWRLVSRELEDSYLASPKDRHRRKSSRLPSDPGPIAAPQASSSSSPSSFSSGSGDESLTVAAVSSTLSSRAKPDGWHNTHNWRSIRVALRDARNIDSKAVKCR